jgi:hypothetical protein
MTLIKTTAQLTAGLLLGALACLTLSSAEAKTVPGNSCTTRDDVSPWGPYMLANTDGQVLCPLVRQLNAGSLANAWARVEHPGSALTSTDCWLYAKDELDIVQSSKTATTSVAGKQALNFNAGTLTTYPGGYYYIGCNLKAGGKMIGARWEEI